MFKSITIGQYYPAGSLLHKLDPRVKIVGTLAFIVSIFLVRNWGYIIAAAFLVSMLIISRVPIRHFLRGLKAVWIILVVTAALNVFLTPGDPLWQWGVLKITNEGIVMAMLMGIRLVFLIIGASVMTLTTTPTKLTDGMEKLFSPLKRIGAPIHEIAMMISIALRFIPILLEETDKIKKAQMARGADFEGKGLVKRIRAMIPLLVPLFVSAFRRANDLAMAMEARCYHGGKGRTQMKPLRYERFDIAAYLVLLAYFIIMILVRIFLGW